jgi:hypothetical protein
MAVSLGRSGVTAGRNLRIYFEISSAGYFT